MLRRLLAISLAFSALANWGTSWGQAASPFDKSSGGSGEGYPSRPVRVVVPFGTGAPDTIARVISQQLTVQMGQNFVVDNRPGANGIVGNETVAKATPDGQTLLIVSASFVVNPSIYRKLPYDAQKDFAPVTNICALDAFILAVHPSVPAKTVQDLIALARKGDRKLAYSSPGIGNTIHLAGALFNARAGINMVHVPYKGGGPATIALLGGEVQAMFSNASLALAHIKAGKLRALGVTGAKRLSYLPDVPTLTEAGVNGMEIDAGWFGMFAPANTSPAILAKLHREVRTALANRQVRDRLVEQGFVPVGDTPAEFKAHLAQEFKAYAEMVQLAGIKPE
jgi:tripartite-type tricarboxylate transporter receptor subunit TctC